MSFNLAQSPVELAGRNLDYEEMWVSIGDCPLLKMWGWMRITMKAMRFLAEWVLLSSMMPGLIWARQEAGQNPADASHGGQSKPCHAKTSEKAFLKNLWCDQKAIWTVPVHSGSHLGLVIPLAAATAGLIAADKYAGREISEHPPGTIYRAGTDISLLGSAEGVVGITGTMYGIARLAHNEQMRTTALLSFEALADAGIVQEILKVTTQRERPTEANGRMLIDDARGKFWAGGYSFPSGHAMSAWALASILASRYRDKPAVKYGAYGLAALVSVARLPARQHFPSDVLVGSVFGYLIGHYVARSHHP